MLQSGLKAAVLGVEIVVGPLGTLAGPLLLGSVGEGAVYVLDAQIDRRLIPGAFILQEVVEKPLLELQTVIGIKLGKMLVPVNLQPLLGRA